MPMDTRQLPYSKQTISGEKHPDRLSAEAFRSAVWVRDQGKDRATGAPLVKWDPHWDKQGQVCHLRSRGAYPDLAVDPDNAVLLSGRMHWLSDGRGGKRLRMTDPKSGEPATDGSKPIRFILTDKVGAVIWERIS